MVLYTLLQNSCSRARGGSKLWRSRQRGTKIVRHSSGERRMEQVCAPEVDGEGQLRASRLSKRDRW